MYKKYLNSPSFWAILFIAVILAFRVSWMGKGVYAFTDETRYEASQQLVSHCLEGNFKEGLNCLLKTDARPVDCLLHALPALVQQLLPHAQGINHPGALRAVQYFHVVLFGLLAWVFYRITVILFPEEAYYPLFALLLYLLLVSNHVHARHILPYDLALLLLLSALYLVLRAHREQGFISTKLNYTVGILTGLACLAYPGYYWFPVLLLGYLYLYNGRRGMEGITEVIPFVLGLGLVWGFFEIIYWSYEGSLLYSLAGLSLGINQGDYAQSLTFILDYLGETNDRLGWIMAAVFLVMGVLSLAKLLNKQKQFDPLAVLLGFAFAGWAFHMVLGEVFHFMVFYGRLIHGFVPFIVWALIFAAVRLKWLGRPVLAVALYFAVLSFYDFHTTYSSIAYPRDVRYQYTLYSNQGIASSVIALDAVQPDSACNIHRPYAHYVLGDRVQDSTIAFYNAAILYPIEGQEVVSCVENFDRLLFSESYYLCFAPYGYEGYTVAARKQLQNGQYKTQVWLKKRRPVSAVIP